MINIIKNYLGIRSNGRHNDYWFKDTLIEEIKLSCEVTSYEILCFDRKKNLSFHKKYLYKKLDCYTNEILCSHMVIIRMRSSEKNIVMKMLGQICKDNNCYGPIVFSNDNHILFFPKLRYQEGYLLKSILENHFNYKNFCIAYGSNDLVII